MNKIAYKLSSKILSECINAIEEGLSIAEVWGVLEVIKFQLDKATTKLKNIIDSDPILKKEYEELVNEIFSDLETQEDGDENE